jgi:hypothetical protein
MLGDVLDSARVTDYRGGARAMAWQAAGLWEERLVVRSEAWGVHGARYGHTSLAPPRQ